MAANDFTYARIALPTDVPVKNTEASSDIASGLVVKLDASNPVSATQGEPGVLIATTDDFPFGVTVEKIKNGKEGRVATQGIVQCVASAAITAGAVVQASTVGKVVTASAAKPQLGQALTATAADADKLLVSLHIAKNA